MRGGRYKTIPSPALPGHLSPRGASVTLDPSTRIYFLVSVSVLPPVGNVPLHPSTRISFLVPVSELPPVGSETLGPMAYREGEGT